MKHWKKRLAFLLAVILSVTAIPEGAYAAALLGEPAIEDRYVEKAWEPENDETAERTPEDAAGAELQGEPKAETDGQLPEDSEAANGISQPSVEPSAAVRAELEESFIAMTAGQELHQTNSERNYYIFAPSESGWYHLEIKSSQTDNAFTAGVYQTIYYEGDTEKKRTYQDFNYKVSNVTRADQAMWLTGGEKYVFYCEMSRFEDPDSLDVSLNIKQETITGMEVASQPSQPSSKAFIGTGMKIKILFGDQTESDIIAPVQCSYQETVDGVASSTNTLVQILDWNGIAYADGQTMDKSLQVVSIDGSSDALDFSQLEPGEHTVSFSIGSFTMDTPVMVSEGNIASLTVVDKDKDTFTQYFGESLGNITVKVTYNDGTPEQTLNSWDFTQYLLMETQGPDGTMYPMQTTLIDQYLTSGGDFGVVDVTVMYRGVTTTYPITINENPYNGISVHPTRTIYYANTSFVDSQYPFHFSGDKMEAADVGSVTLSRKDGQEADVFSGLSAIPGNTSNAYSSFGLRHDGRKYSVIDSFIEAGGQYGTNQATVAYRDFQTTYPVEIRENPYERIEIIQEPDKTEYNHSTNTQYLKMAGLVFRAYKQDGTYDTYTYGEQAGEGTDVGSDWTRYFRYYTDKINWDKDYWYSYEGERSVFVVFMGCQTSFTIQVTKPDEPIKPEKPVFTALKVIQAPKQTMYYVAEKQHAYHICPDTEGIELQLTDTKGVTKKYRPGYYPGLYDEPDESGEYGSWSDVNKLEYDWSQLDWSTPGVYPVSVLVGDLEDTFEVTLVDSPVTSFKLMRMPNKDTYFRYEGESMDLRGTAYQMTFADGSVQAVTLSKANPELSFVYQKKHYRILLDWKKVNSSGNPTIGENAIVFTIFGQDYQTDPIQIKDNPIQSIQVKQNPEKMAYVGDDREIDLKGAVFEIVDVDGTTEEISVTEHQSSILVPKYNRSITAQFLDNVDMTETDTSYKKKLILTYMNQETQISVEPNPSALDPLALTDGGQAEVNQKECKYRVFSFTPETDQRMYLYCIGSDMDTAPSGTNYMVDFYEGEKRMISNDRVGGWNTPFDTTRELTAGKTYYFVVSQKNHTMAYEPGVRFQCYLSSEVTNESELGEITQWKVINPGRTVWYDFELNASDPVLSNMSLSFNGTAHQLTYQNGWTEKKYIWSGMAGTTIWYAGKILSVAWKYEQTQDAWKPEIRDDNAKIFTYGENIRQEVPIQLGGASPVESISINHNPFESLYAYQATIDSRGSAEGLSVTLHYKDETRPDQTVVWDNNPYQEFEQYPFTFSGIQSTDQTGEDGRPLYRFNVSYMDVSVDCLFSFQNNPMKEFRLIEKPQKQALYPFEGSGVADLYGMKFAVVYQDGSEKQVTVTEHGNTLKPFEDTQTAVQAKRSQNALLLSYMGHEQKIMDYETLPIPVDQAKEMKLEQLYYAVLHWGNLYDIYQIKAEDDCQYTYQVSGNLNHTIYLYNEAGEEQDKKNGTTSGGAKMQWDMSGGEVFYMVVKTTESDKLGCLISTLQSETLEKQEITEVSLTVPVPVAGEAFPAIDQSNLRGCQISASQWHGGEDADGLADFATAHRLTIVLSPERGFCFTEDTVALLNGEPLTAKTLGSDQTLTLYHTFPYTDCRIVLPEAEGYTLHTDQNEKQGRVTYGGTYRFQYLKDGEPDESLTVKANGNIVALDPDGCYTLENVTENIEVLVKPKEETDIGEDESKLTLYNGSADIYDMMIGKKGKTIQDNVNGETSLPMLPSYVDGSDQFFYGWYLEKDASWNGYGTRFTSITELIESEYLLYSKLASGLFTYMQNNRQVTYQAISFDEWNKMTVRVKNVRRPMLRNASGVHAIDADDTDTLVIPATLQQEPMQEELGITIADCQVVAIADEAFAKDEDLRAVTLPDTLISIGASAFQDCKSLEEITIPDGVTQIGDHAFAGCDALHKVVFPDTIEDYGERIFEGCDNLQIVLPNTLEKIDKKAFEGATNVSFICSSELEQTGILDELKQAGMQVRIVDITFDQADGDGVKIFSYGDDEERLTVKVSVGGEETNGRHVTWEYSETDAYTYQVTENALTVTPRRLTTEEDEIWVTAIDAETNAKKSMALYTVASDLERKDSNGDSFYIVEVADDQVYSGEELYPAVTVRKRAGNAALLADSDYEVSYTDNVNAGVGQVTVTGKGNYIGSVTKDFTIAKAEQTVLAFDLEKTTENLIVSLGARSSGDGALIYESSNPEVATIDAYGILMIRGAGTSEITIQALESGNYKESAPKTVTLTVKPFDFLLPKPDLPVPKPDDNPANPSDPYAPIQPGDAGQTPDAAAGIQIAKTTYTVAFGSRPFALKATAGAAIRYQSSNAKVASVNASGVVTPRQCGKAVITLTAGAAKRTISVQVVPKKAKAKAASKKDGELKVSWSRQKEASGYAIEYSTDKTFRKNVKRKFVNKNKTTSVTLKKLSQGKKYYVRVKAYTKIGSKKLYGAASKTIGKKIKKS